MIEKTSAMGGLLSSAVQDALKNSPLQSAKPANQAGSFGDAMAQALQSASDAAAKSAQMTERLQMDDPTASVEETVLAMNTSSLQFTAVLQARNKLLQAYNDVMNMPV